MRPEHMAFRNPRVVKESALPHSETLHHGARADVRDGRERHNLRETQGAESEIERGLRGLGCVAFAPVRFREPPPDLDAWTKGQILRHAQSDETEVWMGRTPSR